MPGSFVDDVCDRERPAQRIAGYAVNCRDCTKMTDGRLVCTGRCFDVLPVGELPSQDFSDTRKLTEHIRRQSYLAVCCCDACRDDVANVLLQRLARDDLAERVAQKSAV